MATIVLPLVQPSICVSDDQSISPSEFSDIKETQTFCILRPPSVLCNTFVFFLVMFFYVSICPLRFEGVENKIWSVVCLAFKFVFTVELK